MPSTLPRVRITELRQVRLKTVRDVGEIEPAWNPGRKTRFQVGGGSFVEVHTDQGLVGIGPAVDDRIIADLNELLAGEDPFDIDRHANRLRYYIPDLPYRGYAGVDIALWDLMGKVSGQPLSKLWGGGREKVIPYASLIQLSTPEERADLAASLKAEGWRAIKLRLHHPSMREDLRTVEMVRKRVGDEMTIMVDGNQAQSNGDWQPGIQWDFRRAVETACALQEMGCYWLEEPLPRFHFRQIAALNHRVEMPIAGGENNRGLHEFRQMVQRDVYDVLQPESMVLGGVTALRKIAVMAETFCKKIVPHHGGGNIGVIAHLHFVASCRQAPYLELLHDPPVGDYRHRFAMMSDAPQVDSEGYISVPQGPGLGIQVDESLIERG